MGTYRISELAAHSGLPATTLRYYEQQGLLSAARTPSGYRQYTDADRDRLRFVAAAKDLGLPLERIRSLLGVWDGGRCGTVRDELRPMIEAQAAASQERIDDLQVFRDRLVAALEHLRALPARDGPCDPGCAFLEQVPRPVVPVACSLDVPAHRDRVGEWRRLVDGARVLRTSDGGRSVRLPVERAQEVVRLVVAEQRCCPFLAFRLDFPGSHVDLVAHAPAGAEDLLDTLLAGEPVPC